jgi:predicted lipid-binding transport protein (Tim44 family)
VAPPDENLVALVATVVSFALVCPLLVKWWPKHLPRPRRRPARSAASAPARPTARPEDSTAAGADPARRPPAASADPARRPPAVPSAGARRAPVAAAATVPPRPPSREPATRTAAARGTRASAR